MLQMHLSFHPLEVVSVERTAEDAVCLTLAVPPALRERFLHHAGQYVTVRRPIDGIEERRTYSIVTAAGRLGDAARCSGTDGRAHVAGACAAAPGRRQARCGHSGGTFSHGGGSGENPVLCRVCIGQRHHSGAVVGDRYPRARAAKPGYADLRQPQYGAHDVPRGDARPQEPLHREVLGVFRDEPRAAARGAHERPYRCRQGRGHGARDSRYRVRGRIFRLRTRGHGR